MGIIVTQEEVLARFVAKHGEAYDYTQFVYAGMNNKGTVVCHKHGDPYEFYPTPGNHIKGSGCPKCAGTLQMTQQEFVGKASSKHNNFYSYSNAKYVNSQTHVLVTCPVHGDWLIKPNNHLSGKGCGKCAKSILKTLDEVLSEFLLVHGDRYDYSKVVYFGVDKDIDIYCKKHSHWFTQSPRAHGRGCGCPMCASEVRSEKKCITKEEAISRSKKAHGDLFNYTSTKITNNPLTITVKCVSRGHIITQPLFTHLISKGCPVCNGWTAGNVDLIKEKFVDQHGDLYDYSLITEYSGAKEKVKIICNKHGVFEQEVSSHTTGAGCPTCGRQDSKAEIEVFEFVQSLQLNAERRNCSLIGKELDVYIAEKNFAIEFNGLYWHSDRPKNSKNPINRHKDKTDACKAKGIHLFHLYEDDWSFRQETVKHTLRHLLGVSEKTVYARKTTIKQHKLAEVKEFYNNYHMQGAPYQGSIIYSLYDDEEMVACMTFSKPSSERGNTETGRYELLRYACKYSVVGGASKLFRHFVKEHNPEAVVSYSDDSMFSGKMYDVLGFTEVGKVAPDYKVIDGKVRRHKSAFRRSELSKRFGGDFDPELSERENCHKNELYRIYNAGLTKWEYT